MKTDSVLIFLLLSKIIKTRLVLLLSLQNTFSDSIMLGTLFKNEHYLRSYSFELELNKNKFLVKM